MGHKNRSSCAAGAFLTMFVMFIVRHCCRPLSSPSSSYCVSAYTPEEGGVQEDVVAAKDGDADEDDTDAAEDARG